MRAVHKAIQEKFQVRRRDNLPFTGRKAFRAVLSELFAELGFDHGAEIGVKHGSYSERLCKCNPNLELLCIDPWESYNRTPTDYMHNAYTVAKKRLAPFNVKLIRKTSMEAVKDVPDGSLDFVYIDALHEFDPVMMDIIHWVPKVRRGGIVSGHDYCWYYQGGVVQAVDAYISAHNIAPWYITQCDREPSWLWVR